MEIVVLILMLAIGPLAVLYGADSRPLGRPDQHGRWRNG
jgi:hypothetical protein